MRGPLPRRSGYAVVPQLELGVGRLAIALRGNQRPDHSALVVRWDDCFHRSGVVVPAMPLPRTESRGSTTEEFCDSIMGSLDLRHELARSMQIFRLAQWPPAFDPDPGTRRRRLAHAVREVTIELASVLRRGDSLLYEPGEVSVPVHSLNGAGCLDRVDPEVDIAVDVDVDVASRPGVTGRHEAEVEAVLDAPIRVSGESANARHRLCSTIEDPCQGQRVGRHHKEREGRV
jgi:hypothetical protein